jgi:hypothetical protein
VPTHSSAIGVLAARGRFLQADDALAFAVAVGDDAELDLGAFLQRLARDVELLPLR